MSQESAESINRIGPMGWLDAFSRPAGDEAPAENDTLTLAIAGHSASIEALLREHYPSVHRVCLRMMGNREDAEDAAQEALMRMLNKLSAYDPARAFTPWLHSITLNVCRDQLRKRKRRRTESIDNLIAEPPATLNIHQELEVNEELRVLEKALQTLSGKERAAIVLRDIEGLTTAEVAEAMGTREATVRSHISRARTKLKLYRDRIRREDS